jgi:hypothetical protein
MNRAIASLVLALPLLASATGCRLGKEEPSDTSGDEELSSEEQALVADGTEMDVHARRASSVASVPALAIRALDGRRSIDEAVADQADSPSYYQPEGCLTVAIDGRVATYTFDGCTGPFSQVVIRGVEVATFYEGDEEGTIGVHLESENMTLNDVAIEHAADAVVSFPEAGTRRVQWRGGFDGQTDDGRRVTHTSDVVWSVDAEGCRTLDGITTGSIGLRSVENRVEGLTQCGGREACPAGTITSTNRRGLTFTIELDGSDTAMVTGPRGREHEVDLRCEPSGG